MWPVRIRPLLLSLALLVLGCEGGPTEIELDDDLVFTRADGTSAEFEPTVFAWCGAWEEARVLRPSVHVIVGNGMRWWQVIAVLADVEQGERITFPNAFPWNQPRGADVFVNDPPNELSSQVDGSEGWIEFATADCDEDDGGVDLRMEATLGSELAGGAPMTVRGRFRSPITGRP